MYTQGVQDKIIELFENTPDGVDVFFGEKYVNNVNTGEKCFSFKVRKKLPLSEIPENEKLPTTIEVDGITYKTDVYEGDEFKLLACSPAYLTGACFSSWCSDPPNCNSIISQPNTANVIRPVKGGISLISSHNSGYRGTLGLIAIDSITQSYVGLTNVHVAIGDGLYTGYRDPNLLMSNELIDDAFQPPAPGVPSNKIGRVIRFQPWIPSPQGYNYMDAALISISNDPSILSTSESMKQYGITEANSFPFATTAEINAMTSSTELISVGGSTGVKNGVCGLRFAALGTSTVLGETVRGTYLYLDYTDQILFNRIDNTCPWPIYPGDSGSALIGKINNVWKIVGLCFAGSTYQGVACRIDRIAQTLQIQAYTGGTYNFIDENSIKFITLNGLNTTLNVTCGGKTYWHAGLVNLDKPC